MAYLTRSVEVEDSGTKVPSQLVTTNLGSVKIMVSEINLEGLVIEDSADEVTYPATGRSAL
jgi:hypothetical protein